MSQKVKTEDIDGYFLSALGLVKEAGELIRGKVNGVQHYNLKSCDVDLVTEYDKRVEAIITTGLKKKFGNHHFIGEETVADGTKSELTDEPTWIIDPIDGTMNFVHGFPHSCISVGLVIGKKSVLGIVYNPILDQLFTAQESKGAHLNGREIKVSGVKELSKALITTETGTSRDEEKKRNVFENFQTIVNSAHGVRCLGSAALNMCMVALGGADANYEMGIHAWDVAAGDIIVREAGGVCIDPAGGPFDIMSRRVLCASNIELAQEISNVLDQYYPERD